jgi:hypothetical protein
MTNRLCIGHCATFGYSFAGTEVKYDLKSLDIKRMIVESNREYQKRAMASYRLCVPSESYFTSVPAKEYPNVAQCPIHNLFVISPDEMKPFGNVLSEALSTKQPWYAEVYPTNK